MSFSNKNHLKPKYRRINILMLLIATSSLGINLAYAEKSKYPITEQHKKMAATAAHNGVAIKYIKKNAPSHYVVKVNDTLWMIAGKFLTKPLLWPALWGTNKSKIENPHLIYPGQHLYLIKKNGFAYLSSTPTDKFSTIKLYPQIRSEGITQAVSTIPLEVLKAFMTQAKIFDSNEVNNAGKIVAGQEEKKMIFSSNDTIYVKGLNNAEKLQVFKKPLAVYQPFKDDKTGKKEILGYEAQFAANLVKIADHSDVASYKITDAVQEVELSDLAINSALSYDIKSMYNIIPQTAPNGLNAMVAKVYGDNQYAAQGFVIAINKGANQGIKNGYVFKIMKPERNIDDITTKSKVDIITLPEVETGYAIVFATNANISYAFVSKSNNTIESGYTLTSE